MSVAIRSDNSARSRIDEIRQTEIGSVRSTKTASRPLSLRHGMCYPGAQAAAARCANELG
jgi:hypothetical protein